MARASTPTLLSLDRWARIMGLDPVHFNGGQSTNLFPIKHNRCEDLWPQWPWQYHDHLGREDVARAIYDAERDIAELIGFWPAPKWEAQEVHRFPRHHRRDVWRQGGMSVRGGRTSIKCKYGKFIQGGRRNVDTLIGTATGATLVYDLAALTATITLPYTATSDACEIKAYFAGYSAAPEWEIRPADSVTFTATSVVLVFDAWLLLDPTLWEAYPTSADFGAIDISAAGNYVTSVEVYREFNDWSQTNVTFYWEPRPEVISSFCTCGGSGCVACTLTTQNGCLHVRDTEAGLVVPAPGTYDSDDGEWDQTAYDECRDPDHVSLWYYSGDYSDRWRADEVCDPLSDFWAHSIAWVATARLERPFCQCGPVTAMARHLREDMALLGEKSYQTDINILNNPLGSRRGEVMAWQRINRVARKRISGGVL